MITNKIYESSYSSFINSVKNELIQVDEKSNFSIFDNKTSMKTTNDFKVLPSLLLESYLIGLGFNKTFQFYETDIKIIIEKIVTFNKPPLINLENFEI